MKKINIYPLFAAALFAAMFAFVSCSDDDETEATDKELTEENHWGLSDAEWNEWLRQEALLEDSMNIAYVLRQLCDVEEDALGNNKYTFKYGEQLDMARPGIYTLADSTAEDAEKRFWWLMPGVLADSIRTNFPGRLDYTTDYGSIRYERGDGVNTFGTIYVDIPEIPDVEQITIVPAAFWPDNDSSTPFTYGSVWQEKSTGYKYVCVRERYGGQKGIMVTYDGGWSGLDYWKGKNGALKDTYTSWIYDNLSSEPAARALDEFVRYQTDRARRAFDAMGQSRYFKPGSGDSRWYATSRSGRKFHWGPSDYHYELKIYQLRIGANEYSTIEWKTCDGTTHDMSANKIWLMYSQEFDYMSAGQRDVSWNRLMK